jgi:hypothetical protein
MASKHLSGTQFQCSYAPTPGPVAIHIPGMPYPYKVPNHAARHREPCRMHYLHSHFDYTTLLLCRKAMCLRHCICQCMCNTLREASAFMLPCLVHEDQPIWIPLAETHHQLNFPPWQTSMQVSINSDVKQDAGTLTLHRPWLPNSSSWILCM